eukprot:3653838-Pyramimonas_sp.AAC.1
MTRLSALRPSRSPPFMAPRGHGSRAMVSSAADDVSTAVPLLLRPPEVFPWRSAWVFCCRAAVAFCWSSRLRLQHHCYFRR